MEILPAPCELDDDFAPVVFHIDAVADFTCCFWYEVKAGEVRFCFLLFWHSIVVPAPLPPVAGLRCAYSERRGEMTGCGFC